MQKNAFQKQQIILFTFVPKLILIRCTSLPENYATFARSLTVISLCDLFWYDLLSLPKVTGYNLYRTAPNKPRVDCVRL